MIPALFFDAFRNLAKTAAIAITYRQRLHEEVHVPLILKETKGED